MGGGGLDSLPDVQSKGTAHLFEMHVSMVEFHGENPAVELSEGHPKVGERDANGGSVNNTTQVATMNILACDRL